MWKIVELKGNIEKKEAYEYHIERWGTISSLYFKSFEYSNWGSHLIYSYIFNGDEYVSQPDKNMGFFMKQVYLIKWDVYYYVYLIVQMIIIKLIGKIC